MQRISAQWRKPKTDGRQEWSGRAARTGSPWLNLACLCLSAWLWAPLSPAVGALHGTASEALEGQFQGVWTRAVDELQEAPHPMMMAQGCRWGGSEENLGPSEVPLSSVELPTCAWSYFSNPNKS